MLKIIDSVTEGRVLALAALNYSQSVIVKQLKSENIIISRSSVSNIINQNGIRRSGAIYGNENRHRDRPKRTPEIVRKVRNMVNKDPVPSQYTMASKVEVSTRTIRRIIYDELNLTKKRKKQVHSLNERQIQIRKINSRKLIRGPIREENFEFLVTLDEAWLYIDDCGSGSLTYYAKKGEKSTEIVQKSKDKRYGKKLMVLAIRTGRGVLPLQFIPPKVKINGKYYIDHVLIPLVSKWLPKLYPEGLDRVFVHHDAAPAHICSEAEKIMKKLSDSTKITFISKRDIPIKSPDASPLDFFGFGYLKQQLTQHKVKTLDDLRRTANRIWSGIPSELVQKSSDRGVSDSI